MALTPDVYWLALRQVRGVGPRTCQILLERFKSPQEIFSRDERELAESGIPRPTARNIAEFRDFEPLERELCELPRINAQLVRWTDDDYPPLLRQIADPPPYLFFRGRLIPDEMRCVAIVGARTASDAGRHMAHRLGLELAARGFTVVSGLARGIDGQAHQGALDAGGRTIAVMGCGIDVVYPAEHRVLAESIIEAGGALLSELPVGTPPVAENFPGRNRILSGLCLGAVIVEAAERSGSLITARTALEQNRQVFAVPGSPISGKTRGSNRLLKEGARLVECVEDVIEELAPQLAEAAKAGATPADKIRSQIGAESSVNKVSAEPIDENPGITVSNSSKAVFELLQNNHKLHIDSIIEGSGLNAQTVLRLLLELELKGLVTQHPGKLFSLVSQRQDGRA
ncbi:MAG: DNA-processing protein DprA [Candidatus Binataceae bacterium]